MTFRIIRSDYRTLQAISPTLTDKTCWFTENFWRGDAVRPKLGTTRELRARRHILTGVRWQWPKLHIDLAN
jgi:hypothetical protein